MPTFNNIGLQEPSTITARVASVTITRGSTAEQQEILVIGDSDSSGAIARVVASAPASTDWGLVVRPVGESTTVNVSSVAGNVRVVNSSAADLLASVAQSGAWSVAVSNYSTTVNVSSLAGKVAVVNSSAADLQATVAQASTVWAVQLSNYSTTGNVSSVAGKVSVVNSSAADLNVTVAGYSTTVNVSSLAGKVAVVNSSAVDLQATVTPASTTWAVQLSNYSTIAAISSLAGRVLVDQNSTVWITQARLHDGQSNAIESAISSPSSNARGLVVRQVIHPSLTYSASTTGQSSATTMVSSAATTKPAVFAYSITSTLAGPVAWGIYAGATRLWGGVLAAVSSAISGANVAVSPPACLFQGSTGAPLTFNCETSNAGLNVSVAYWVST